MSGNPLASLDTALQAALASGRLVDALIALVLLESALALWWHRRSGAGLAPRQLLPTLGAGLGLLLAWRAAASDAPGPVVALALLGAGVAHAADLAGRWSRKPGG